MNLFDTVILGVVEGLTGFLPISSTGHLILAGYLLGANNETANTFQVFIQLGAILAVVFLYSERFKMLFQPGDEKSFSGLRGWQILAVTSFPAMVVGFFLHDAIKQHLFNPVTVACALGLGGAILIVVDRLKLKQSTETLDGITFRQALFIGIFQCFSLWPGVSRAGATIIGGLFSGLNRNIAAEFSFIAAVPIMCIATTYDLIKSLDHLKVSDFTYFALGFIVAFFSAILAIKFFIRLLQRTTLSPFGVYRIAIAVIFLWIMGNQQLI